MKIGAMYSHLNGFEWIQYHQKAMWNEMSGVLKKINAEDYKTKISKEKTMKGKVLYSHGDLNKRIKADFE